MAADDKILIQLQQQIEGTPANALVSEMETLQKAAKNEKKNPHVHFAMGMMACRMGDFRSGIKSLKQANKLDGENGIILGSLAYAHMTGLADFGAGLEYLEKRLSGDPDNHGVKLMMAHCLLQLGEPAQALKYINEAAPGAIDPIQTHVMRSNCYVQMQDPVSARKEYEAIKALDPSGIAAVGDMLAALPDNTPEQLQALHDEIYEAISNKPESFRDDAHRCLTYTALGDLAERLSKHEQAFAYFKTANETQPEDKALKPFTSTREFEIQRLVFNAEFLSGIESKGHQSREQVFVVGMPFSGVPLVNDILGQHDKVVALGELEYFNKQAQLIGITSFQGDDLERHVETLKHNLASAPKDGYVNIGKQYINGYGIDKMKGIIKVDSMPLNFRALGFVSMVFPNAKIIEVVRHPLDVCLTIFKSPLRGYNRTYANDMETLGNLYKEYISLMAYWREVLPMEIHQVRYETLIEKQVETTSAMYEFLDLNREEVSPVDFDAQSEIGIWQNYKNELKPLIDILSDEIQAYEAEA